MCFALDFRTKNILHRIQSTFRPFLADAVKAMSSLKCPQKYCPVEVSAGRAMSNPFAMQCNSASHIWLFSQNLETWPATQLAGLCAVTARTASQKYDMGDLQNCNLLSRNSAGWQSQLTVWTRLALLRTVRKSAPGPFPSFWWLTGNLWRSLACGSITLISAFMFQCSPCVCVCVQMSPFIQLLAKLC